MAQTGTLIKCTDGLEPFFTSTNPNGDRAFPSVGTDALRAFFIDGDLENGSRIAIKTDGTYNFGNKDSRFKSLSILGNELRENDSVNTWFGALSNGSYVPATDTTNTLTPSDPNSPWYGSVGVKKVANGRSGSYPVNFRALGFKSFKSGAEGGQLTWPRVYSNNGRNGFAGDLFYASWVKYNYSRCGETNKISYINLVGTFDTGANGIPSPDNNVDMIGIGERATFLSPINGTALGYVRYVDTAEQVVYFELDEPANWERPDFTNATVTGNVSGATLTLNTAAIYQPEGSQKDSRLYATAQTNNGNIRAMIATSLNQFTVTCTDINGNEVFREGMGTFSPVREWHRVTQWIDCRPNSSGNGVAGIIINGVGGTVEFPVGFRDTANGVVLANWGTECSSDNGLAVDFGELVSYTDLLSVVISESPTWAGVNHLTAEPQILLDGRSNNVAYLRINKGAHTSLVGKYIYVLSAPNSPINTTGIQITEV